MTEKIKVGLMLEEADIDGDGKIDLQEFTRLLSGLPQGPQVGINNFVKDFNYVKHYPN